MRGRSLNQEAEATAALLDCAGLFSPRVQHLSSAPMWEAVLDLTGTERLLGEPAVLGKQLLERIARLGLQAWLTVCGNVDAGRSLSRFWDDVSVGAAKTKADSLRE